MSSIKFLGTGGARFVVAKQLRSSGGVWLNLNGTDILIDPGPGCLVKCVKSRPKLNPAKLDAIILTHRHLDHSTDINIMIEAMTEGGFKKRGVVFAPNDALEDDPVILRYLRTFVEEIKILKESKHYCVRNVEFDTPKRHIHASETYGLNIKSEKVSLSFISDTEYFENLETYYTGDIVIINVVRLETKEGLLHLAVPDAERIIKFIKPKMAVLTHFGTMMLKAKPYEIAANMESKLGIKIIAAHDGMEIDL